MPRQLTFDLTRRPALGRGDFFVSPANAAAVATVEGWQDWPSGKLILTGPPASGKTHLAHVWAAMTEARILPADELTDDAVPRLATGAVAIEDADRLPPAAEPALFHLHNLCLAENLPLLLTAGTPPRQWPLALADLASRMQATATARLEPPDDALLMAVLVKHLSDRQLEITPDVLSYALNRMERRFDAAAALASALNRAAFARRAKTLSKRIVGEVLDNMANDPP